MWSRPVFELLTLLLLAHGSECDALNLHVRKFGCTAPPFNEKQRFNLRSLEGHENEVDPCNVAQRASQGQSGLVRLYDKRQSHRTNTYK